jgi:hypothetical protein
MKISFWELLDFNPRTGIIFFFNSYSQTNFYQLYIASIVTLTSKLLINNVKYEKSFPKLLVL